MVRARSPYGQTFLRYNIVGPMYTDIALSITVVLASFSYVAMAKPRCTRVQLPKGLSRVSGAENIQRYVGEMLEVVCEARKRSEILLSYHS